MRMSLGFLNFKILNRIILLIWLFITSSCATFKKQTDSSLHQSVNKQNTIVHTMFVAGGYGNGKLSNTNALALLREKINKENENSTLVFTGDNITGDEENWKVDRSYIDTLLKYTKDFKGKTHLLLGQNEWKSKNTKKVEATEDYLKKLDLHNISVSPENVCPIEHRVINDVLDMIIVDSRWFTTDWNRTDFINQKCSNIKTRRRFAEELEGYINDAQGKNLIIAMHHPIFSNGAYNGYKTLERHTLPIPIISSLASEITDLAGFSPDQLSNRRYRYLSILLSSLAQKSNRVTFISGHEQSLQFLKGGDINQIISGSLGEVSPTRLNKDEINAVGGGLQYKGIYTNGAKGFTKLTFYDDGSVTTQFYTESDMVPKEFRVLDKLPNKKRDVLKNKRLPKTYTASIFTDSSKLNKSGFYKFWWGDRFRSYYGKKVTARVADLDTLYGGLTVEKKGGGHQSFSLRLVTKDGQEYAMRSLRKNALKFLKFKVRGIAYTEDDYKGTWAEKVVSDFFTTSHPYMQLVINPLAKAAKVNHANTQLFYVPKQPALNDYLDDYGDEFYYIEQRPSDEHHDYEGYQRANPQMKGTVPDFESTTDVLEKIKSDESYEIDQLSYIRARVFDMLIGDWDRHEDQWRWAEYDLKNSKKKVLLPIPRDRDAAFSKFDGFSLKLVKLFVPSTRFWQSYGGTVKDVKWFNAEGNNLDRALLNKYGADIWEKEALLIKQNITDSVIEQAFKKLPLEVRDSVSIGFKKKLQQRLADLPQLAKEYGRYINKVIAIHATEKDDKVIINRFKNGETTITIKRLLSDEKDPTFYYRTFNDKNQKEIWIYGLGDDDEFIVTGESNKTLIRLIGGYGSDSYSIENRRKIKVYDWSYEESTFTNENPRKNMSNMYKANTFHWRYFRENHNIFLPNIGFTTDDGFYLGARNTYTNNGFNSDPYRQQHKLSANYYFNFQGIELEYAAKFANVLPRWNFEIDAYFTNEKFINNFFGFGNETINLDDDLGRDFNRARMRQVKLNAGLRYRTLQIKGIFESYRIENTADRFFTPENLNNLVFNSQEYIGLESEVYYKNEDASDFPTKAIYFGLTAGYKKNINLTENEFGYLSVNMGFSRKLTSSGDLVLGSTAEWKTNIGNEYFFYHAPSIGGDNGLRGYRNERFTGRTYFYQTSELRLRLKRYITPAVPITFGLYGGFDYGRVWVSNDTSDRWHTSQGGGIWISALKKLAINLGVFNSKEDNIIQVGLGFDF